MAKDTNELADEQDNVADAVERPQSVRDAIMAARDEVEEKADKDVSKDVKRTDEDKPDKVLAKRERTDSGRGKESKEDEREEIKDTSEEVENDSTEKVEDKPTVKTKAPVGWTKEAKAKWNELPPEIQESVLKREKEVSDGFAGTKQAQERLKEIDAVIQPRLQSIQQFGASPAQTINKLFEWMEVLSHQNEGVRYQGFKTLADNFKIDLTKFAPQQQTQQETNAGVQDTIPSWAQSLTAKQQEIENRIANQAQEQAQREAIQRQETSKSYVENWVAQSKAVHFDKVRAVMHSLIVSGAVPLKSNGDLDLDTAYNKAIRMDDEVWESIQQDKADAAAAEKAKADAKKKAEADKARKAGASLRPAAPTANLNGSRSSTAKSNMSVSQSIRDAVKELSE